MALINVVKYNGGPKVFAWKYPNEALGTWTQLIVNESQEAVLFKSGQALDVFEGGTYTLDTPNIPLLNNIINLPFGGRSPFAAEVWYVNKAYSLDIKWGTATPIQLQDPKYGIFLPVRSFGQFGLVIDDSKKFLMKLVGTLPSFDKTSLTDFFRGLYVTRVKDAISSYLVHKKISMLEINAYLNEISTFMQERIAPEFDEYGIKLVNFYVNDINIPEDDPSLVALRKALEKRAEMDIIGYDYQQKRSFDTLEGAAANPGSASSHFMGAGIGLGMGTTMGGSFGRQFSGMGDMMNTSRTKTRNCPHCHTNMNEQDRFCPSCGYDTMETQAKTDARITCSHCGNTYDSTVKFCPNCGDKYNPCPNCKADMEQGSTKCESCGHTLEAPIACPTCGATLDNKNIKFCYECGSSLEKHCPKCNATIDGTPKFCQECGEKLE